MYGRVSNRIPGLPAQLDASSPSSCDSEKCLQTLPRVPWEAKHAPLRTAALQDLGKGVGQKSGDRLGPGGAGGGREPEGHAGVCPPVRLVPRALLTLQALACVLLLL